METIGRLAGGVAHDFNTLLTVILGYCDLLLADLDAPDPRRGDIEQIQKAGERAGSLTRQLLAFSRKQTIDPMVFDLSVAVFDVQSMLERLLTKAITISLHLAVEPSRVLADRGEIEQIVMNLAVNARDAMPDGGTLVIETANVELDGQSRTTPLDLPPGSYVRLTMTDSGSGMTPDVRAHLFEPFFTTKGPGKGTGLGLATVHGIVTRCGGAIGIDSEIGKGTSFTLFFPSHHAAEAIADPLAGVEGAR
jgi:two-component system cell cycle sensor histidine kinase/response regulator CckA